MKKVFFGVAVVAIALSASAFTNAENVKVNRFVKTYYQQPNGSYSINPPSGSTCGSQNANPCELVYTDSTPTPNSFLDYASRPAGTTESFGTGYIQ